MTHIPTLSARLVAIVTGIAALLPAAQAADTSLADLSWSAVGAAGLIGGTATVPVSPAANPAFGFVTTAGGVPNVTPLLLKTDGRGSETATNGSKIVSGSFSALSDERLVLQFNYVSTDGRGYDDYAWARLVDSASNNTAAWLFTARSTNSARGNVVPGDVLTRQQDNSLPDELDATLNNGDSVGFGVSSTTWQPLGGFSGYCWDTANTCGPSGWIRSDYTFTRSGSYRLEFGVVNWGDEVFDSALAFDFAGLKPAGFPGLALVTAVPEPGSWAMMAAGLGLLGGMVRRRRRSAG